jgi:hypothetical protein
MHRSSNAPVLSMVGMGEKILCFWQKHSPKCDSMGLPPYPASLLIDSWVRREGYGGPELGEKVFFKLFDLYSIDECYLFIVTSHFM